MRKIYTYGKPISGELILIPQSLLANYSSVIGALYEIHMEVEIKDQSKLNDDNIKVLQKMMYEQHRAKLKYFEVKEINGKTYSVMQVSGSPFSFSAFVAFLVQALPIIGLAVFVTGVYYIVKKHPLATTVILTGGAILFLMFGFGLFTGPTKSATKTAKTAESTALAIMRRSNMQNA